MCGAARAISLRLAYLQQMGRWVVAFLAAALVGCGGGSGPLGSKDEIGKVSSSEQMRVALSDAGLSCSDYQAVAKNDRKFGTENATDVGKCELEGETIELAVWKDRGQVENWMGFSKTLGCSIGKALGVSSFDYVAADTWVISNVSATLARKISDAVGGTPHHVDLGSCSDQDPPVGSGPRVTVTETATQTVTQPPSTVAVPSSAPSLPSGGGPAAGSAAEPDLDGQPVQAGALTVFEEGCALVASQEYNYFSAGGYDHIDQSAVAHELERRGWPESAAQAGAEYGIRCGSLRPKRPAVWDSPPGG